MAATPEVSSSRAATVARTLSADLRCDLRLSDELLTTWDALVGIAEALNGVAASDWNWREAMSKIIDCSGPMIEEEAGNGVLEAIGEGGEFSYWAGRVPDPNFRGLLRRLLGAATYRELRDGFVADSVAISSAMYRMIEMAMPAVIAWADTCDVVPAEQIQRASGQDLVGSTLFNFVVELYQKCGDRLELLTRLPVAEVIAEGRTAEYSGLGLTGLETPCERLSAMEPDYV